MFGASSALSCPALMLLIGMGTNICFDGWVEEWQRVQHFLTWHCPHARRSAGSGSMSGAELADVLAGAAADQVTVLKPLELQSHEGHWRRAVWCAPCRRCCCLGISEAAAQGRALPWSS